MRLRGWSGWYLHCRLWHLQIEEKSRDGRTEKYVATRTRVPYFFLKIRHENNNHDCLSFVNIHYSIHLRILFPFIHVTTFTELLETIFNHLGLEGPNFQKYGSRGFFMNIVLGKQIGPIIYRIAGKFGGELNLAVWRSSL